MTETARNVSGGFSYSPSRLTLFFKELGRTFNRSVQPVLQQVYFPVYKVPSKALFSSTFVSVTPGIPGIMPLLLSS